ncbi:hypothetical protein [Actinomadura sp. GTD37]|uniref:hypothetical protein n=1 Tax=Actinomadura sp. GTD37 TaxID=1778030 RepID=UPI0035BF923F
MLTSRRTRILRIQTFDIGALPPLDDILEHLRGLGLNAGFQQRNSRFFDPGYSKPLIVVQGSPQTEEITSCFDGTGHSAHSRHLIHGDLQHSVYISASGIGCLILDTEIHHDMSTQDMLQAANLLASPDFSATLSNNTQVNPRIFAEKIKDTLRPLVKSTRTNFQRIYTMIHIIELCTEAHEEATAKMMPVYDLYEHEFHALSVRVIIDWEKRYPAGLKYNEPNQSLSPAGVLRVNTRNTLVYDYPYTRKDIEDLYYPAITEVRIWDMLIACQLQHVQRLLARYEVHPPTEVSAQYVEDVRQDVLRTFNEIDGFYLATAKRTRNFYRHAYEEFHIKDLRTLLESKTGQLERLLDIAQASSKAARQMEAIDQQRHLLQKSQERAETERATNFTLILIAITTGVSAAINLGTAFKLQSWLLPIALLTIAAYLLVWLIGKRTRRARPARFTFSHEIPADRTLADIEQSLVADQRCRSLTVGNTNLAWEFTVKFRGGKYLVHASTTLQTAGSDPGSTLLLCTDVSATYSWKKHRSLPPSQVLKEEARTRALSMMKPKKT